MKLRNSTDGVPNMYGRYNGVSTLLSIEAPVKTMFGATSKNAQERRSRTSYFRYEAFLHLKVELSSVPEPEI